MVRSDNSTNFVGGEKELRQVMRNWKDDSKAKAHVLKKEIKWEFNSPAAQFPYGRDMGKTYQNGKKGAECHP